MFGSGLQGLEPRNPYTLNPKPYTLNPKASDLRCLTFAFERGARFEVGFGALGVA